MVDTLMAVYIDPPEVEPYKHGLFGAAKDIPWDPHFEIGGAEFETMAAYVSAVYPAGHTIANGSGGSKSVNSGLGTTTLWPFAVYGGITCGSIGWTPAEFEARAERVLALSSQHPAENALWTGAGANKPNLNVAGTHDVTGGTATELITALGLLENWLADHYAGIGVVHARRQLAGRASFKKLIEKPDGPDGELFTPLGTQWVFGGGYDGTGPNAAAPSSATQTWIYITGEVFISRGEAVMPAGYEESINRVTNQTTLIVEQPYIIGVDGVIAAALIDLTL